MLQAWETMPLYFISSATKRKGREEILNYIEDLNNSPMAKKIKARIY